MRIIKILERKTDGKTFGVILCCTHYASAQLLYDLLIWKGFQYLFTAFYQIRVMKILERKTDRKTFGVKLCCTYCA